MKMSMTWGRLDRWHHPTWSVSCASTDPPTWDVYERLDVSLDPTGPDQPHDLAAELLPDDGTVLDVGCREAADLIRIVRDRNAAGAGVEPVPLHLDRARAAVAAAALGYRITLHEGGVEELPGLDVRFDLVWCRDVLTQVADLDGVLAAIARALRPSGRVLIQVTFATALLHGADVDLLHRHLGNVHENLNRRVVESAFRRAELSVERTIEVGTEWREHAEERTQPMSRALLRLARLRRQRDALAEDHGADVVDHVEANLHWEVFQALGKLEPVIFILGHTRP
ncbi:class I SAM-dependent methyltransferase (plasmid) [Iamia sp. SCSIO 61187]|uniref:class I SAM-dependent methyltransferase n=1 Tax=Iamia sp. SCSIO 61187 TaxID=2722752 RepID=UPI001C627030|nr:class I SAM-dependent methyltransferase [Iamia sp. SCSIO 61187]QYG95842.1 class I SAM-dependent methyltransferase [Iamia sp. SCSIO 61187]